MGLLDAFDSDQFRLGLGLLAAGGARSDGMGFGGRVQEAFGSLDQFKKQKAAEEYRKMQIEQERQVTLERQQAVAQKKANDDAIRRAFMPVQGGAPTLENAAMQGQIPQFNPRTFLQNNPGADISALEGAMKLNQSMQPEKQKFSTAPQYDQNGRAFILSEDGSMKYLDGVKARDKLNEVRLGNKVGFRTDYSPDLMGSMDIGQSPDSVASNQVSMRGQNMTDSRARDFNAITQQTNGIKLGEKEQAASLAKSGQVASFDVMLGSLDRLGKHPGLARSVGITGAFPTMPGSESANFKAELDTFQSQAFLPMVSQLKGMGALSDAEGKKLTAAVGALNPAMGEKAFRASIERITGDMAAARSRLTGESLGKPKADALPSLPTANSSNKGRKIRDTETGKVLVSNGMTWVAQ